jgi:ubiquitin C-terminal hydrolase
MAEYFGSSDWEKHVHSDRPGEALAKETAAIIGMMNTTTSTVIAPGSFVKTFVSFASELNDEIRPGRQACSAETIQILLDGLHMQLARKVTMNITGRGSTPERIEMLESLQSWSRFYKEEYSPIIDKMYGQILSRIQCSCGRTSNSYEPFNVLKLEIPGAEVAGSTAPILEECINSFFTSEVMDDFTCEACNERGKSKKELSISRFPKYMTVMLKRYTKKGHKVQARIPYDERNIDFSKHRAWPTLQKEEVARYSLRATIEHAGSRHFGHYVSRVKKGDKWYLFDDASISECSAGGAAGPNTYVLFLERK